MHVSRRLGRFIAGVSTIALLAIGSVSAVVPASAAPTWAPAATAPIRPGVQTITAGAQCTANFVLTNGTDVFIGQAAHCSGTGGSTETNGCDSGSLPVGTPVSIKSATAPAQTFTGTMVYNSWLTMQGRGESNPDTCAYNDFALIKLNPADYGKVNPSIPRWGGPTGVNSTGTAPGETVYTYGNSSLRFGVSQTSPKTGRSLGTCCSGWSHDVYTATPGIPGDSGSAFLDKNGRALGVLSTVQIAPLAASNGVGDVSHEIAYMQSYSSFGSVNIALGTQPFTP